jgi:hypothetical protein
MQMGTLSLSPYSLLVLSLIAVLPCTGVAMPPRLLAESNSSISTVCDSDPATATDAYHKLRDLLQSGAFTDKDLELMEHTLLQLTPTCRAPGGAPTIANLLLLIANQLKVTGDPAGADAAFQHAYSYTQAHQSGILNEVAVMQAWSDLKLSRDDTNAARQLAVTQSSKVLRAYSGNEVGAGYVVFALRFQQHVLYATGDANGAERLNPQIDNLLKTAKRCSGLCVERQN